MQFLFIPENGTREHFSAATVEDAQIHAAKVYAGIPGTVWRIDYVSHTA